METRQSNSCAICGTPTYIGCEHTKNTSKKIEDEPAIDTDKDLPVMDFFELEKKEQAKNEIMNEIKRELETILLGSYTINSGADGAVAEDIFGEPTNTKEVLNNIKIMLELAISDKWTKEFCIQRLSSVKLRFDSQDLKNRYDDFWPLRKEEEPIDNFVDVEKIADKLYNT